MPDRHGRNGATARGAPPALPWALAAGWLLLLSGWLIVEVMGGATLPHYPAYRDAAARVAEGAPLYGSAEAAQAGLRHEQARLTGSGAPPDGPPPQPAYLYPPTLALVLGGSGLADTPWPQVALVAASVAGVAVIAALMVGAAGASAWWVLLAVLSVDVAWQLTHGNAELPGLALAIAGCWLLHHRRPLAAAPLLALAVLIKPLFGPLIGAFALMRLATAPDRGGEARRIALAAALALALVALEVLRWPAAVRADMADWLANAIAFTPYALADPAPFDGWNRAPMQVLVTLGADPATAQAAALALALLVLALAIVALRRRGRGAPGFVPLLAAAYLVSLVARPTTWTLPFLEIAVLLAAWPVLAPTARRLALTAAIALAASRWTATAITLAGGPPLMVTLQTAALPFETVLVLPAATALTLRALHAPLHTRRKTPPAP
ncbi:MAG: glycosyltransferase 87 family protein [Pseudomonadota bacterium]